jgi:hypothetical protein
MAQPLYLNNYQSDRNITVLKADPNAVIYQGQVVVEDTVTGRFKLATTTTPAASRGWIVTQESPAKHRYVSVCFKGITKALFASPAALTTFNNHLSHYTGVTNKGAAINASGIINGNALGTTAGTVYTNNSTPTLDVIKKYVNGFVTSSKEASVEKCNVQAITTAFPTAIYAYVLVR